MTDLKTADGICISVTIKVMASIGVERVVDSAERRQITMRKSAVNMDYNSSH